MSALNHRKSTIAALLLAVSPIFLSACGSSDSTDNSTQPTSGAEQITSGDTANPVLNQTPAENVPGAVSTTAIGQVLSFGAASRTLYTFDNDTDGVSNCNGGCAATWSPITASTAQNGEPFSTVLRDDGTNQWAYNRWPLYYYEGDAAEGEVNGDGIGGVWHAARLTPITIGTTTLGETYIARGSTIIGAGDATTRNDYDGFSLYTFRNDTTGTSTCNGACASNWPPLYADAGAIDNKNFTVINRDDDSKQWAVNGKPLYFFSGDSQPGDTTGNGVGGVWDIAQP